MREKFDSIDEAIIKTGQSCKICNQAIKLTPDKDSPVRFFPHFNLTDGTKAFSIGRGLVKHESGLCYYHLKKKQGLIDGLTEFEKEKLRTGRALRDG
jgi:hypothetical protein